MKYALLFIVLTGCMASIPEETGSIEAFFCDQVDCAQIFAEKASNAQSVDCAMYHADKGFFDSAGSKARFVVDEGHSLPNAVKESGSGLMHDKFCVMDDFVWTGSWNPNQEMKIPNNVVLIQSKTLASAYQSEFDELFGKIFHKGASNPGLVKFNGQLLEAYFCPEDKCQSHVLKALKKSEKSIHFMTYSFTDDEIGELLKSKKIQGIDVKGVFRAPNEKGGEYPGLKDVSKKGNVHHKVFIIDGSTVITGSYNPSKNANELNDENVVIIRDPQIAEQFENEFNRFI